MKARIKGGDKPFQEIDTVQFKDSWNMVKAENLEFQPSVLARVVSNDNHWQEVKERAAIAAMQGTLAILGSSDRTAFRDVVVTGYKGKERTYPKEIAEFAVACADALVEQLKKK